MSRISTSPVVGYGWPDRHEHPGLVFGFRRSSEHVHQGIDIMAPEGTPIVAAADGVVVLVLERFMHGLRGYGRLIVIGHPGNRWTLYAHLARADVRAGMRVRAGDRIGAVGKTAWRTAAMEEFVESGAHLHYEVLTRWPMREEPDHGAIIDRIDPVRWHAGGGLMGFLTLAAAAGGAAAWWWRRGRRRR